VDVSEFSSRRVRSFFGITIGDVNVRSPGFLSRDSQNRSLQLSRERVREDNSRWIRQLNKPKQPWPLIRRLSERLIVTRKSIAALYGQTGEIVSDSTQSRLRLEFRSLIIR
jgi:hypothetical protein